MSGTLHIAFAPDMPAAAVEVVAPDWTTVDRVWLAPGQQASVDVPSEASFLRVHLASGETVSLQDPGNLNRVITRAQLVGRGDIARGVRSAPPVQTSSVRGLQQIRTYHVESTQGAMESEGALETRLAGDIRVRLLGPGGGAAVGHGDDAGVSVRFSPARIESPYELMLEATELSVTVSIPGMIQELVVRSDGIGHGARVISVRVRTINQIADAIGAYMHRGDMHSAETITGWAATAEDLLDAKQRNPFAAAVGAYLLLRLRRFDLLHDWTSYLANRFPDISDGRVIWAWQQIYKRGDESAIREALRQALSGPLPVFTEGLQLLRDGAQSLGPEAVAELNAKCGTVFWSSPFTATSRDQSTTRNTAAPVSVNIDYAPTA